MKYCVFHWNVDDFVYDCIEEETCMADYILKQAYSKSRRRITRKVEEHIRLSTFMCMCTRAHFLRKT